MVCFALSACDSDPSGAINEASEAPAGSREAAAYLRDLNLEDPLACFETGIELDGGSFELAEGTQADRPPTRVIVAIDASGSMAGRIDGTPKIELASRAASAFRRGLPQRTQTGLLVFGQAGDNTPKGKRRSCRSVELAVPLSSDRTALQDAVAAVQPTGWTPLASALDRAERLLSASDIPGEQVIYIVSDGEETCDGDPVAAARRINQGRTRAIINIIGFEVADAEAAALQAVASAGGGSFINTRSANAVSAAAARVREARRQSRNRVSAARSTSGNRVKIARAISRARVCTSRIISRERAEVARDISRRRAKGEADEVAVEATRLLQQRHDRIMRQTQDYTEQLEQGRNVSFRQIERGAEIAR